MKKATFKIGLLAVAAALITFSSCTKDPDVKPEVEQEEYDAARIQYIELNADGSETTDTTTISFDKAGVPSPSHSHLHPGEKYRTLITLYYNGNSINHEIVEDGAAHKFFFVPSIAGGITNYTYNDADVNGRGIGLDGVTTVGEGEFDLKVVLRHGINKAHAAAAAWNSTNYQEAGGSDDLNVMFEIHAEEGDGGH